MVISERLRAIREQKELSQSNPLIYENFTLIQIQNYNANALSLCPALQSA